MDQQTLQSFQSQLNNVSNVLIILRPNPSFDAIASAVSLALSFEKAQKKVSVFCPTPMTVEFGNLVGINHVTPAVGSKNLVVTLKGFAKLGVDKVSYNVDGDDFNLVVVPKPDSPAFDQNSVVFSHSGVDTQLIVLINVQKLEDLGEFYQKEKDLFGKMPVANIDSNNINTNFAQFNLTNPAASSCVEIIGYLLQYLKYQIDSDIATNVFYGLMQSTGSLSGAKCRAETYELVGMMMRMGARRIQVMQFVGQQMLGGQKTEPQMTAIQNIEMQMPTQMPAQMYQAAPMAVPTQIPAPTQNVQPPLASPSSASVGVQPIVPIAGPTSENSALNPPADWTQPKIYKGGNFG